MRLITWLIGVAVAITTILFAVSNRETVSITLWPFPFALDVGIYIVVLAGVFSGFLVGALVTWLAGAKHRRRVRLQRAEIRTLEGELADIRSRLAEAIKQRAA
ncbi:MAG: LapA family protein [Rhodospirillaceae bacterium]